MYIYEGFGKEKLSKLRVSRYEFYIIIKTSSYKTTTHSDEVWLLLYATYVSRHIYIYIYTYSRYHTITDVYTTALLLTKPSSDDDSGFRHGFGAEASLQIYIYMYIYIYM